MSYPQTKAHLPFGSFCELVMYFLARISGSELIVGAVLGDTLSQRCLSHYYENLLSLQISIFILCATRYLFPTRYSSLDVSCFLSLHSLIEQTSIGHPLCARHFREARRIKLALTSKKEDVLK